MQSPGLGRTGQGGAGPRASPHRRPEHTPHSWGTKEKPPRADRTKGRALQNHCSPQPLGAEHDPSRSASSPVPHHIPGVPAAGAREDSAVPAHAAPQHRGLEPPGPHPAAGSGRGWGSSTAPAWPPREVHAAPKPAQGQTQLPQSPKNRARVLAEALTPCRATEGLRQALQGLGDPRPAPLSPDTLTPRCPPPRGSHAAPGAPSTRVAL